MRKKDLKIYLENKLTIENGFQKIKAQIDYENIFREAKSKPLVYKLFLKKIISFCFILLIVIIYSIIDFSRPILKNSNDNHYQRELHNLSFPIAKISYLTDNFENKLKFIESGYQKTFYELEFFEDDHYYTCGYIDFAIYRLITNFNPPLETNDFLNLQKYRLLIDEGIINENSFPIKWIEVNKSKDIPRFSENMQLFIVLGSKDVKVNSNILESKQLNLNSKIYFEYEWEENNFFANAVKKKETATEYQNLFGKVLLFSKKYQSSEINGKIINVLFPNILTMRNSFYKISYYQNRQFIEIIIGYTNYDGEYFNLIYYQFGSYLHKIMPAQNGYKEIFKDRKIYQIGYFDYQRLALIIKGCEMKGGI